MGRFSKCLVTLLAAASILASGPAGAAVDEPAAWPAVKETDLLPMWEIVSDVRRRSVVYLVGAMASGKRRVRELDPAVEQALEISDALVVWFDGTTEAFEYDLELSREELYLSSDSLTLKDRLGAELYKALTAFVREEGQRITRFDGLRPWFLPGWVVRKIYDRAGYDLDFALSHALIQRAEVRIPVVELDEPLRLLRELSSIDDSAVAAQLGYVLEHLEQIRQLPDLYAAALAGGDLRWIEEVESTALDPEDARWPYYEVTHFRQSERLAGALAVLLEQEGVRLAVLPDFVVIGDRGVPALLKAKGYSVRRLRRGDDLPEFKARKEKVDQARPLLELRRFEHASLDGGLDEEEMSKLGCPPCRHAELTGPFEELRDIYVTQRPERTLSATELGVGVVTELPFPIEETRSTFAVMFIPGLEGIGDFSSMEEIDDFLSEHAEPMEDIRDFEPRVASIPGSDRFFMAISFGPQTLLMGFASEAEAAAFAGSLGIETQTVSVPEETMAEFRRSLLSVSNPGLLQGFAPDELELCPALDEFIHAAHTGFVQLRGPQRYGHESSPSVWYSTVLAKPASECTVWESERTFLRCELVESLEEHDLNARLVYDDVVAQVRECLSDGWTFRETSSDDIGLRRLDAKHRKTGRSVGVKLWKLRGTGSHDVSLEVE
jgi:uncharacterized protein YbaP (TraB family)